MRLEALDQLAALVAWLVQSLLSWAGLDALRHGAYLYVPGAFGYEVGIGCTGLLPAGVAAALVAAAPAPATAKRRCLAFGIPFVLAVNLFRLAHLFYLGVRAPALFAPAHEVIWQGVMLAAVGIAASAAFHRQEPVQQADQRL